MKKIFYLLFFIMLSFSALSQEKAYYFEATRAIILKGDTLKTTTQIDDNDSIMATKQYVLNIAGAGNGWDSLTYSPANGYIVWWYAGSRIDSISVDNRYVELADSGIVYVTPTQLDTALNNSGAIMVYSVRLPYATTVAGRIAGATAGDDYPILWSLTEGANSVDLKITHNMGRRVASVAVYSVTGTAERQLFNSAAYSGILSQDNNTVEIESLATITKPIAIYLLFE